MSPKEVELSVIDLVTLCINHIYVCCLITWLLTYLLIPRSRVLLEKLTGFQLVKKFPTLYGTRKFITTFTNARYLSLSWASWIQSIPPHPTSWRSVSILSSHLHLGLPSGLFPQVFPLKPCMHLSSPPYVLHVPPICLLYIKSLSNACLL